MRDSLLRVSVLWIFVSSFLPSQAHAQQAVAPAVTTAAYPNKSGDQEVSETSVKFRLIRILDGKTTSGAWCKTFEITTSDGHEMYTQNCPRLNVTLSVVTKRWVKSAEKVLDRTQEANEKGEAVGERILLSFAKNERVQTAPDNKPHYVLLWTRGSAFNKIAGERVEDVLALEKRIRRKTNAAVAWDNIIE
jgi:hypothetical protein